MKPKIKEYHYGPDPAIFDLVSRMVKGKVRILEVGGGRSPFPLATEHVDWGAWPSLRNKRAHRIDINTEPLPFRDKAFDFVYCRHTLEDIYNPYFAASELLRVAKAGYIETPSPVAECCTGIEGGAPWRGYSHHRSIIWPEGRTLKILPKYPMIEHLGLTAVTSRLIEALNAGAIFWNSYLFWKGAFTIELLEHDRDFRVHTNYGKLVASSLQQSVRNSNRVIRIVSSGQPWRQQARRLHDLIR